MAYEAEIITDRTVRRGVKVTRLGYVVGSILRTRPEGSNWRTEILTEFNGRDLTVGVRQYSRDGKKPDKVVWAIDKILVSHILQGATAAVTPPRDATFAPMLSFLPGEPNLLD